MYVSLEIIISISLQSYLLVSLQETMREQCEECELLCIDIEFNYETTMADIQNNSILWHDPTYPRKRPKAGS